MGLSLAIMDQEAFQLDKSRWRMEYITTGSRMILFGVQPQPPTRLKGAGTQTVWNVTEINM